MTPEESIKICNRIVYEHVPSPLPTGWSSDSVLQCHILDNLISIRLLLAKICDERLVGPV
jgi:hypothetical protein